MIEIEIELFFDHVYCVQMVFYLDTYIGRLRLCYGDAVVRLEISSRIRISCTFFSNRIRVYRIYRDLPTTVPLAPRIDRPAITSSSSHPTRPLP
jgi:hypothetical protein